jgi:hypothetical protein
VTETALAKVTEIQPRAGDTPEPKRRRRSRQQAEEVVRYFLSKDGSSIEKPELGVEVPSEGEALIRTAPAADPHASQRTSAETTDEEIRKIASMVLTQALMGTENIARDSAKSAPDRVQINLEQVYRSKDQLYIRYSVTNQTRTPFRLTTPDVSAPLPTQQPIYCEDCETVSTSTWRRCGVCDSESIVELAPLFGGPPDPGPVPAAAIAIDDRRLVA